MGRILITGVGIITAIGNGVEENRNALRDANSGIGKAVYFQSKFNVKLPFGEVPFSTEALRKITGLQNPHLTRTEYLAYIAADAAIKDATLHSGELSSTQTALIGASTVGGMCLTDELYMDANTKGQIGSPYLNRYSNSANTMFLQNKWDIGGIINTFNTACSSSSNAIMYGARLIKNGLAKRAIVGGVDCLAKYTVNGFNAMMILSGQPCRPFDENRNGLNLGEGAAFLVLEREEDVLNEKKIYAEIKGFGNSNDAHHPSSTSPQGDGPYLCMQRALDTANISPKQIDFINAHGTATENNDITESIAMKRLFTNNVPPFISTKSYTGHTLGAAGAVEAVYSILSIHFQEVYPSLHFEKPIPETGLIPQLAYQQKPVNHVMSNSFGFGGNCTSLVFGKF